MLCCEVSCDTHVVQGSGLRPLGRWSHSLQGLGRIALVQEINPSCEHIQQNDAFINVNEQWQLFIFVYLSLFDDSLIYDCMFYHTVLTES
jgi:hypothetical protein